MISDKEHAKLRNLLTPIVNYFKILETLSNSDSISDFYKLSDILFKEDEKIKKILPKILKIVKPDFK